MFALAQFILQQYGDVICPRDWHVEGFFDFYRLYYAKGGEASYSDANGSFPLLKDTLYLFPRMSYYQITHNPDNPFDVLWFHVNAVSNRNAGVMRIEVEKDSFLYHILQCLKHIAHSSQFLAEKLLDALFDSIGFMYKTSSEISWIFDYIDANHGKECANKKLAEMLGYSEKYFIKLFAKTTGMNPHQYVMDIRMVYAAKFLLEGKSIKVTADTLGYNTVGNFSRDFKLHYKQSPKDYVSHFEYKP